MLGNVQNKIIQAVQCQLNNFFFSSSIHCQSHFFVNFVMPHVCWCVSVDVSFYLKWGFVRQGHGFETGSWYLRDVGLSLDLGF